MGNCRHCRWPRAHRTVCSTNYLRATAATTLFCSAQSVFSSGAQKQRRCRRNEDSRAFLPPCQLPPTPQFCLGLRTNRRRGGWGPREEGQSGGTLSLRSAGGGPAPSRRVLAAQDGNQREREEHRPTEEEGRRRATDTFGKNGKEGEKEEKKKCRNGAVAWQRRPPLSLRPSVMERGREGGIGPRETERGRREGRKEGRRRRRQ